MAVVLAGSAFAACQPSATTTDASPDGGGAVCPPGPSPAGSNAVALVDEGMETFRYDTFGDEAFWGGTLGLHDAIQGAALGGVGGGLSPAAALGLGLKVDVDALPAELQASLAAGEVDLDDPATTIALLSLDAVVGVKGFMAAPPGPPALESIGITCAFCHSTVDDSFAPGIGHRLDGWPNQDLDVGAIVALAPDLSPYTGLLGVDAATVRAVLMSWGPGKYDAELSNDGKAFAPDGSSGSTVIPPALRLAGMNVHTYTGWGSLSYWNAYVAVTQMHGIGSFYDPRLDDVVRFPLAAANGFGHISVAPEADRVTPKLAGLQLYQLSLPIPAPPDGYFDATAAARGKVVFEGAGNCASCHVPPLMTEPGFSMHSAAEMGIDDFQAMRSPDGLYRTAPLMALHTHDARGFYHDGRFPTLADVVDHYEALFSLGLTPAQQLDLIEYLKSL